MNTDALAYPVIGFDSRGDLRAHEPLPFAELIERACRAVEAHEAHWYDEELAAGKATASRRTGRRNRPIS